MSAPAESISWVGGTTNNRQLLRTARIGLGGLLAYSVYKGWHLPIEALALTILCILLATWPIMRWLHTQQYPFPAFETFMLTTITAYAMPLITDHIGVLRYPMGVVLKSLGGVVLFLVCALVAFAHTRAIQRTTRFWTEPIFNRQVTPWLHCGLWLTTLYVFIHAFTSWISYDIDSVLRAIFFGIGTACSFLLGRSWGNDELNPRAKFSVVTALTISAIVQISSLYLINTISGILVFFLAYISAGKRIPFIPLMCLFAVLTVLHNGKAQMREKYWQEGAPAVQLSELPDFFGEWLDHGLAPFTESEVTVTKRGLLERASLLHMMCLAVNETNNDLPLLGGETYGYVLPMLVPRFFWPEKPSGQLAVQRLGIHFGLQSEESARNTSIGFGVLVESYANFGMLGLAALGLLIGFFAKIITTWTRTSPLLSSGGLLMILLMAWALQVELIMSGWVSSLFQACVCMLGIPYAIKKLFN
jgi:hypothetical protein